MSTIMTVTLSRLLMGSMAWSASELATEQRRSTISSEEEKDAMKRRESVEKMGQGVKCEEKK
jgi:hypothetical protein